MQLQRALVSFLLAELLHFLHYEALTKRSDIQDFYEVLNRLCQTIYRQSPLHVATEIKEEGLLTWLLGQGLIGDINEKNDSGYTALHVAASIGNVAIVQHLLAQGADRSIANKNGRTAFEMARSRGHQGVMDCLSGRPSLSSGPVPRRITLGASRPGFFATSASADRQTSSVNSSSSSSSSSASSSSSSSSSSRWQNSSNH